MIRRADHDSLLPPEGGDLATWAEIFAAFDVEKKESRQIGECLESIW